MIALYLTVLSLFLSLQATAWPTLQLFERDGNSTDTGSDSSGDGDSAGMDLAMKAFAFNFGYTALSANSSCGGKLYPCIELVVFIG